MVIREEGFIMAEFMVAHAKQVTAVEEACGCAAQVIIF